MPLSKNSLGRVLIGFFIILSGSKITTRLFRVLVNFWRFSQLFLLFNDAIPYLLKSYTPSVFVFQIPLTIA